MCGDNSDSRYWALTPELQKKFDEVQAQTRKLQKEFGITPMTIEERYQAYERRKAEDAQKQEELKKLQERIGRTRPLPKWKV